MQCRTFRVWLGRVTPIWERRVTNIVYSLLSRRVQGIQHHHPKHRPSSFIHLCVPRFCDPEPRYFFLLSVDSPELLPLPFSFSLLLSDRLIEATATFYLFTGSCGKDWNQHEWRAVPVLVCPLADSGGGENQPRLFPTTATLFLCHILTQVQFGLLSPEEVVSTTKRRQQTTQTAQTGHPRL